MKKKIVLLAILMALVIPFVTGCEPKREDVTFDGEEGSITFNLKQELGYKISTNKDDFRTSREQAVLIGDGFKIGIEFDDDYGYVFKGDWDKVVERKKENNDVEEVTYSDIKGIQYFYGGRTSSSP